MGVRVFGLVGVVLVALVTTALAEPRDPRDPVRLRLGTQAIDGSRYMKDILALGKEIEKRTRGAVQLDWVSGGQLGDEGAMAKLIATGALDGGGLSETGLSALVPEMAAWRSPGMFRTYEEVDRATAALDATVRDQFTQRGLTFAMWADLGFSQVFSTAPITSLRAVLEQAAPWITLPLDGALTEAITSGRAQAWTMPALYMLAIGSTKAHAMTDLRYRYVVGGLVFSHEAWSRLSATEQQVVLEVCHEREARIRASWRKETERGLTSLRKSGVALHTASEAELAAFAEAATRQRMAQAKQPALGELRAKIVAAVAPP
ncbi:MAG: TRAP transporter substrate-binding protein DctP [Myxococcales bacterium]|nr:TRAP transporter substrate-binding protein DctP [Myxococcales bacterium]